MFYVKLYGTNICTSVVFNSVVYHQNSVTPLERVENGTELQKIEQTPIIVVFSLSDFDGTTHVTRI